MSHPSASLPILLLAGLIALPAASFCHAGESWASLHNGGNTSVEASDLPLTWRPGKGVAWSMALPLNCSTSSPRGATTSAELSAMRGMEPFSAPTSTPKISSNRTRCRNFRTTSMPRKMFANTRPIMSPLTAWSG